MYIDLKKKISQAWRPKTHGVKCRFGNLTKNNDMIHVLPPIIGVTVLQVLLQHSGKTAKLILAKVLSGYKIEVST